MAKNPGENGDDSIPRSSLDNGLYTQGSIDLSNLTPDEEQRLRELDYRAYGNGTTLQDPLVQLKPQEYAEFRDLLEKCGRKLLIKNPAKSFFEE